MALLRHYQPPALLSRLNEVEILHVARRETLLKDATGQPLLTAAQYQAGLALFERHIQNGVLGFVDMDHDEVFDAAVELSRKHGLSKLVRTADLLHIAMMEFGFDEFVTADRQQHEFALVAGYKSVFLPP